MQLPEGYATGPVAAIALVAPARSLIGRGARAVLPEAVAQFGRSVLMLRSASVPWADSLEADLRARGLEVTGITARGEPGVDQLRAGLAQARAAGAECVLAIGGGAVIDLGKAIAGLFHAEGDVLDYLGLGTAAAPGGARPALPDPLPFVAVPTTAGTGAEATSNAVIGVPERGLKISLRDPRMVPDLAVVDPALCDGLPRALTLATGLDALTQLIESYLSCRATPLTDALCRGMIGPAAAALRVLMRTEDPSARDTLSKASYLSGLALANAGLGVVHGLAAVIGSRGGAHGAICGRLLPAALQVNREVLTRIGAQTARFDEVEGWLTAGLGGGLRGFIDANGLADLDALHCPPALWDATAQAARTASSTQANPVQLSVPEIRRILSLSA